MVASKQRPGLRTHPTMQPDGSLRAHLPQQQLSLPRSDPGLSVKRLSLHPDDNPYPHYPRDGVGVVDTY